MKIINEFVQWDLEWLQYRKGKITWTSLKWVTWWPKAQLTEIYTLLAETYIEEEDLRPFEIMERWNILEDVAKLFFQDITWKKVEEVWFIEKDDIHWLSPDGIIKNWDKYTEALEIKCPMWKNYIKYYIEEKIPDEYKNQVINYFIVIEDLEKLYFMIYNPDVINGLEKYKIIEVTRQDLQDDIAKAIQKLELFKKDFYLLKNRLCL